MSKSAGELLLQRVHAVIRAARLFEEFESAERFSLRVENEPYMPLVIESWPASDALQGEKRRVLVAHYIQSGEHQLPDPELEMTDGGFPVRLRQTVCEVLETPVLWRDATTGQIMLNGRGKRDIAELLRVWSRNIRAQGFIEAASRIVSTEHRDVSAMLSREWRAKNPGDHSTTPRNTET